MFAQDICPTSGIAWSQGRFIPIFVRKFYTVLHDGFIKLWKDSLNRGQVGPEVFLKNVSWLPRGRWVEDKGLLHLSEPLVWVDGML